MHHSTDQPFAPPAASAASCPNRRLSDALLKAFHQACDQRDVEVATRLADILDEMLTRGPIGQAPVERRRVETTAEVHLRLWHLIHDKPAAR